MTQAEFDRYLEDEIVGDPVRQDLVLSRNIHTVESEFGVLVGPSYNWFKFLSQLSYLSYVNKKTRSKRRK